MIGTVLCLLVLSGVPQDTAAFVTRLGRDTLAVEQYTFDGHTIEGVSVVRTPRVARRVYHGYFAADGRPDSLVLQSGHGGGSSAQTTTFRYSDDSVWIEFRRDTTVRSRGFAAPGRPVPFLPDLMGFWAASLKHAVAGASAELHMPIFAGGKTRTYDIRRGPGDTLDLQIDDHDYGPLRAVLDATGRLQLLDFRATTDKYLAKRVPGVDMDALAADFAAREQAGKGMGILSPRDTARGTIGSAHVMIDYGRPSVRGRQIFGNVVPWNLVWRTGANEATQLITDRDLVIGGTPVPAGTYSIFTLPSTTGWQLIVNKQHGQWGTVYDSTQDLARIPMTVRHLDDAVERLRLEVFRDGPRAEIVVSWEQTQASVALAAR